MIERVERKQLHQMATRDMSARQHHFAVEDAVYVSNFGNGRMWLHGQIKKVTGRPVSFVLWTMMAMIDDDIRTN